MLKEQMYAKQSMMIDKFTANRALLQRRAKTVSNIASMAVDSEDELNAELRSSRYPGGNV